MLQLSTVLVMLFGYPYNNDLVMCKDSPDYLDKNVNSANEAILIRDFCIKHESRNFSVFNSD